MEEAAKSGDHRAAVLLKLLDNPPRSLAPLVLLAMLAIAGMASAATLRAFEGRTLSDAWIAELVAVLSAWIIGSFVSFMLAASRALEAAELAAEPMSLLLTLAAPFMALGAWLTRQAKGSHPIGRGRERVTSDDIQIIVAEGNEERKLDEIAPEEREMIAGILEMGGHTTRDIMIPRPDVIGMEVGAPLDQALDIAAKYGHSRLPVYEEDLDHIVGILHVKDLIQGLRHPHRDVSLRQLLRPVRYVPDTAKADDLLRDLLRNRVHMAVVVDEYGGTAGVVTIEDALEEIVGEIRDEYDAAEEPEYVRVNENEALFNARVPVSEVNAVLSINLPTEESDTLGGLVYTRLGKMPKTGDHIGVDSIELTVTAVVGRRIKQVRVRSLHSDERGETVANKT